MIIGEKFKYLIILAFLILILSGCGRLEMIDKKLGEMFFEDKASSTENLLDKIKEVKISTSSKQKIDVPSEEITAENLTKAQKEKIEKWIEEEGLNRYGDEEGTYYERGTPLIDEAGNTVERFEYILEKHVEVIQMLGN